MKHVENYYYKLGKGVSVEIFDIELRGQDDHLPVDTWGPDKKVGEGHFQNIWRTMSKYDLKKEDVSSFGKRYIPRKHDPVNHPKHYTDHPSGIECIQITEHMGFNLGNAVKYIWRSDLKHDAIEDLKKAKWYIERELEKRAR